MVKTNKTSLIVDKFGNNYPASRPKEKAAGLYSNPYGYGNFGNFKWRQSAPTETELAVSSGERQKLVSLSRGLFAQMPILDFALEQLAEWAIGDAYEIIYTGTDKTFKSAFEDYQNNIWAKNCNVLGSAFDLRTTLKLIIKERLRDGELLQLFTYNRSGLPQLQYVRSHRLAARDNVPTVKGGRYDGALLQDAVVKNSSGAPLGYYIQDQISKDDDYIVAAKDCILIYAPKYFDKGRGIPPIAPGILTGMSVQELHEFAAVMLKIETMMYLKKKTASGEAPSSVTQFDLADDQPVVVNQRRSEIGYMQMAGGVNFLSAPDGEDIESLSSNRPNDEWQDYIATLETNLLACIGWPHQLLFSTEDLSRAPARGITEIARKSIKINQQIAEMGIRPAVVWATGNAIADGIIAPPTDKNWMHHISFTKPAQFTLDAGQERSADIADYKMGLVTKDYITTKYGQRGSNVTEEKTSEVIELWSKCVEAKQDLQKQYPEELKSLTVTSIHNDMLMLAGNPLTEPTPIDNQLNQPSGQ